ncbi:hypothetical protein R5R35_001979 [Gryllus longicercus]|uniref:PH domain-containing protein n=1 Tax=Gryllus longicercus TaxID=2509291 RepID=A0AAN9VX14_9ORTH
MDMKSCDVKDFLQDVNRFLTETLKNEPLSGKAKTERDELAQKVSSLLEPAGPYIDMSGSSKSSQSGEYVSLNTNQAKNTDSKLYEEFPDVHLLNHSGQQDCRHSINIEHLILPASKLRMVGKKFGALSRKERFMGLFVERSIRCYVGLLNQNLYVYNSDKDAKPVTYINVQGFEARPAVTFFPKDAKKRDFGFEVVCPGKKSYQFLASSLNEMEQWINCINEASSHIIENHDSENLPKKLLPKPKCLPPTPSPTVIEDEEYDDVRGHSDCVSEKNEEYGDEIYYNINDLNIIGKERAVQSVDQHSDSKYMTDSELVYDDICPLNPKLYYNVSGQRTETTFESDKTLERTFEYDDDIYDDIGVLLNKSDSKSSCDNTSSNRPNTMLKKEDVLCNTKEHVFSEMITEVTDCILDKGISFNDNLYEPVENPKDE